MKQMYKNFKDRNDKMWSRFHDPKTKISRYGKWYAIAPMIIIFIGIVLLCIPSVGFNLGLDFTGGNVVEATKITNLDDSKRVAEEHLREHGIKYQISTRDSKDTGLGLTVKYQIKRGLTDTEMEEIGRTLVLRIENVAGDGAEVRNAETISASASSERIMMTFISIAVTLIAILLYILFRFKFTSGVAAMIGLIHDVLVVCALVIIFRIQINYSFVAALITMVVYSLNNTIVLFDRIRRKEKMAKNLGSRPPVDQVVDSAVKETSCRQGCFGFHQ